MQRNFFQKPVTVFAFTLAAAAPAASLALEVRPMFKAGYEFGGDTLITVGVIGGTSSTKSIKANDGLFFGGGASILNDAKNLEGEVSLSGKYQAMNFNNGDVTFTRLPLDALFFYRDSRFRLGGGITYHLSPHLKGSRAASGLDAKYDNALGIVLQGDYIFAQRFVFGLRYTSVTYKANSIQTNPAIVASTPASNAKSNGFGVVFSMGF